MRIWQSINWKQLFTLNRTTETAVWPGPSQGGTRSIHDWGSDVFFWVENLHARYFFGSRDLSLIFLGLKKIRIFLGLISKRTFRFGFSLRSVDQKNIHSNFFQRRVFRVLVFFWVGNFDARYFFGSKISGLCIFLGLQYEAPSDPPVMYTSSTPPGWPIRAASHRGCDYSQNRRITPSKLITGEPWYEFKNHKMCAL